MNVFVVSFPKRNVLNMRIIFAIKCLSSHNNKQIERVNSLFIENDGSLARIWNAFELQFWFKMLNQSNFYKNPVLRVHNLLDYELLFYFYTNGLNSVWKIEYIFWINVLLLEKLKLRRNSFEFEFSPISLK